MRINVKFAEQTTSFKTDFGEVHNISDGGYERGYAEGEKVGYNNGYTEGETKGKAEGIEQGKQAEYDAFWDAYQNKGARDNYQMGFSGGGWYPDTFKPKYSMYPITLNSTFWNFGGRHSKEQEDADFVELFDKRGLVFDTSKCTNWMSAFMWARIKRLGVIDLTGAVGSLTTTFAYGEIFNIDKLIVKETTAFISNTFQNQSKLEEIRFEGVIGVNDLNLQWSTKLSHESLMSIINCLQDKSGDTSGTTWKVTIGSTNLAKLTEEEVEIAKNKGWTVE